MNLHVIGAGLAGLAAALAAADAGCMVIVHEAAGQAGGRCRSWVDSAIGQRIDNGTHLIAGGNVGVHGLLVRTGARLSLRAIPEPLQMRDLHGGTWTASGMPMLGTVVESLWRLGFDDRGTMSDRLGRSKQFTNLWEPLTIAILNTPPEIASAQLMRAVLARTIWQGRAKSRLFIAESGLTETFVEPTLAALRALNVQVRYGTPLRFIEMANGRVNHLVFNEERIAVTGSDKIILAVPWWIAGKLLPGLPEFPESPIVNAHFRLESPPAHFPDGAALGLTSGTAQWLFRRGDVLSVTVSAAASVVEQPADDLAQTLWGDVARALNLNQAPLVSRVIKEKRATLLHTSAVELARPISNRGANLWLAGDWTATGLPCTIEGAIQSGLTAARLAVGMAPKWIG